MFSSNQILQISGDLGHQDELHNALQYVIERYGSEVRSFQITADGRYAIGWADHKPDIWTNYPFETSVEILEPIIRKFLNKQIVKDDGWDGGYYKGFLIKSVRESMGDEGNGIKEPFYTIVTIEPYTCFYSK